jgi:uncharacterized protein (DUF927 family)
MNEALIKLAAGDLDAFIAACAADPGFPVNPEALGVLGTLDPAAYERVRARLKAETKVRVRELDRALKDMRTMNGAGRGGKGEGESEADDEEDNKFSLRPTGLYRRTGKKWEWITQLFEVSGQLRDLTSAGWGKVIRFRNSDGATKEIVIGSAALHTDPNQAIGLLADQDMDIKGTLAARRALVEYLVSVKVTGRVTTAQCTGWIEIGGKRAFVLPGEAIGAAVGAVMLARGMEGPYERRGTLADWQNGVGALARDHRLVRVSIAVGLTGPLLDLGGFESGILHLHGRSSEGKTTCVRSAASVWGSGADGGYMRSWRATANGLEGNLAGACDTLLPLDEVGQAEGREIGQSLYMATSGVGKQRMRRDASLRPSHKWRVPILSSGEVPIESRLNEDPRRGRAHAGHLVRAIDISARQGACGAFDRASPDFDPVAFANDLKRAASTHYGTAGPAFVRQLIEHSVTARNVRERVADFVATALAGTKDYHGQAARAAERFGLVATAGELAIEFGIVPWVENSLVADAMALFKAWLAERGGATPYEVRQIVAQVRHFIEANGEARFDDADPPKKKLSHTGSEIEQEHRPVINRAGWRKGSGESRRWYVLPEVWRREICAGFNPTEAARVLSEFGALEQANDGKFAQSLRVLPGMKTQRLYVLTPAIFESGEERVEEEGQVEDCVEV